MENFGKFMLVLITMIVNPLIRGYVFLSLWSWFIVPTLNLNPLRLVEAIGLMFVFSYLTTPLKKQDPPEEGLVVQLITLTITQIAYGGIVLLFGYILVQFM
jgi:hypothetical protein